MAGTKIRALTLVLAAASLVLAGAAQAADFEPVAAQDSAGAFSASLTPFSGWVPGVDGTVGGPRRSVDVSLTPLDIVENIDDFIDILDGIYIGWGEIRSGRFGLFFDMYHLEVSSAASIDRGAISLGLDLAFRQSTGMVAGTYRIWEDQQGHLDAMAGARITDIDINIGVGLNRFNFNRSGGDTWTDAVVGMKGQYALDHKWSLTGWGVIGGGGSDITWDLYGALTYAWRPGMDISAGFRALQIDYDSNDFKWDVLQYGPVVNATFKF
jgi:hypothetical protein